MAPNANKRVRRGKARKYSRDKQREQALYIYLILLTDIFIINFF